MREKIANVLNKTYAALMIVSFFAGFLPLIPFIVAIIIGGEAAEAICLFLYNGYYPWVIVLASVAVMIGLISMYVSKHDFSVSKKAKKAEKTETAEKVEIVVENEEPVENTKVVKGEESAEN